MTQYDQIPAPQPHVQKSQRTVAWTVGRAIVYIVYAFALAAIAIATLAFFLELFGASPTASFTAWVYRSANRVVAPFRGIFPSHALHGQSVLDISMLFAIVMYAIFALLVHELINYLDRRRDESADNDYRDQQLAAQQAAQLAAQQQAARPPVGQPITPPPPSAPPQY